MDINFLKHMKGMVVIGRSVLERRLKTRGHTIVLG